VIKHGKVVLVGRDREKLNQLQKEVERKGGWVRGLAVEIMWLRSASANIVRTAH
jgi:short-subunit dehydrogenase